MGVGLMDTREIDLPMWLRSEPYHILTVIIDLLMLVSGNALTSISEVILHRVLLILG